MGNKKYQDSHSIMLFTGQKREVTVESPTLPNRIMIISNINLLSGKAND